MTSSAELSAALTAAIEAGTELQGDGLAYVTLAISPADVLDVLAARGYRVVPAASGESA